MCILLKIRTKLKLVATDCCFKTTVANLQVNLYVKMLAAGCLPKQITRLNRQLKVTWFYPIVLNSVEYRRLYQPGASYTVT